MLALPKTLPFRQREAAAGNTSSSQSYIVSAVSGGLEAFGFAFCLHQREREREKMDSTHPHIQNEGERYRSAVVDGTGTRGAHPGLRLCGCLCLSRCRRIVRLSGWRSLRLVLRARELIRMRDTAHKENNLSDSSPI